MLHKNFPKLLVSLSNSFPVIQFLKHQYYENKTIKNDI